MSESDSQNETPASRIPWRKVVLGVAGLALIVGLVAGGRWFFTCPCDFTPGSVLWGELVEEPVSDWTFANNVELCQIQVKAPVLPHAVNMNCMATREGDALYISCSQCEPKRWSRMAMRNPEARIRLDGRVYPVHVSRVTDPAEADRSWAARLEKLSLSSVPGSGTPVGMPRPADAQWWTFRAVSRAN
jgi:hypothetical protein